MPSKLDDKYGWGVGRLHEEPGGAVAELCRQRDQLVGMLVYEGYAQPVSEDEVTRAFSKMVEEGAKAAERMRLAFEPLRHAAAGVVCASEGHKLWKETVQGMKVCERCGCLY